MIKIRKDQYPDLINMYVEQKLTLREIAKSFNVSDACIAKIFKQQGIKIENGSNRVANRHVVVDYFEKDTEGAAYFYGLMLADGCMTGRGKRLTIDIQSDDSHILETMKSEINLPNPVAYQIRTNTLTKSCQLSFTVERIYDSFINLGYTVRKSTKEFAPERFLNNRHFWRGLIDGDGSISKPENKNRRVYLCGSKELCDQFLSYCQSINPSVDTQTVLMKGDLYRLSITGIKAATILNELYSNSTLSLNRKLENAEKLIERYPEVRHVF